MLLRNVAPPVLSCHEVSGATFEKCRACASEAVAQLRQGWRKAIGTPDYRAYLTYHAAHHPGVEALSEREYVKMYIDRRYNRRNANTCC